MPQYLHTQEGIVFLRSWVGVETRGKRHYDLTSILRYTGENGVLEDLPQPACVLGQGALGLLVQHVGLALCHLN